MPISVKGSVAHELDVSLKLSGDALRAELEKRNLPVTVFDASEPPLHELKVIEHKPGVTNGSDDTKLSTWGDHE
jgi:hypothetical protein